MEPTPYTFTPNQWGMLQNLVDETGMDMRGIITAALGSFQEAAHKHGYPGITHATEGIHPPRIAPEKRLEAMQRLRSVWTQDTQDFIPDFSVS